MNQAQGLFDYENFPNPKNYALVSQRKKIPGRLSEVIEVSNPILVRTGSQRKMKLAAFGDYKEIRGMYIFLEPSFLFKHCKVYGGDYAKLFCEGRHSYSTSESMEIVWGKDNIVAALESVPELLWQKSHAAARYHTHAYTEYR